MQYLCWRNKNKKQTNKQKKHLKIKVKIRHWIHKLNATFYWILHSSSLHKPIVLIYNTLKNLIKSHIKSFYIRSEITISNKLCLLLCFIPQVFALKVFLLFYRATLAKKALDIFVWLWSVASILVPLLCSLQIKTQWSLKQSTNLMHKELI